MLTSRNDYLSLHFISSIRTWTATAPLPLADGVTFDMKALLCSYSFQAVCLLKNKEVKTAHLTTAEQRVRRLIFLSHVIHSFLS